MKNIKNKMVMMMVITTLASRGSSLLEKIVVSYSGVTVPTTLLWPDINESQIRVWSIPAARFKLTENTKMAIHRFPLVSHFGTYPSPST